MPQVAAARTAAAIVADSTKRGKFLSPMYLHGLILSGRQPHADRAAADVPSASHSTPAPHLSLRKTASSLGMIEKSITGSLHSLRENSTELEEVVQRAVRNLVYS